MSRRQIGIPVDYVIVGRDEDGVEHFIGASCGTGFFMTWLRSLKFHFKRRYRRRYERIYLKPIYDV